jgi:uncharacterized protein YceH (UPF0502 family)
MTEETATQPVEPLNAAEARLLGSLIEKQLTTPESYPLTLNAAVLACNQKTSREPVMELTPGQVGQALRSLEGRGLVRLLMGSRADRWEQRADKALGLVAAQRVLLGLLLLRGPQTPGELLARSGRMHDFEDVGQVLHHLERLAARQLALQLPRQPGQREERFMHLLLDPEESQAIIAARAEGGEASAARDGQAERLAGLEARVAALEQRLAQLGA